MYEKTKLKKTTDTQATSALGIEQSAKTVEFTSGGKDVVLPSLLYVKALERTVEQQGRAIKRLETLLQQQKSALLQHDRSMRAMQHDIDGKLDQYQ